MDIQSDAVSSPTFTASSFTSSFDMLSTLSHSLSTLSGSSSHHHHQTPDDHHDDDVSSNDEIVWDISETSSLTSSEDASESSISIASDDDFIVLSRPLSPGLSHTSLTTHTPSEDYETTYHNVVAELSRVDLVQPPVIAQPLITIHRKGQLKLPKKKKIKKAAAAATTIATKPKKPKEKKKRSELTPTDCVYPSPAPSPPIKRRSKRGASASALKPSPKVPPTQTDKSTKPKKKTKNNSDKVKSAKNAGLGSFPIVDDVSEGGHESEDAQIWKYDEAKQYISAFLSNPVDQSATGRLTFLQSLIIELGLCSVPCSQTTTTIATTTAPSATLFPRSLRAAKALLKTRVFLNIREYVAVREQGQAALQSAMHPSKSALIRDIKKKGKPASLKWVKQHGLQVLLVTCHY